MTNSDKKELLKEIGITLDCFVSDVENVGYVELSDIAKEYRKLLKSYSKKLQKLSDRYYHS